MIAHLQQITPMCIRNIIEDGGNYSKSDNGEEIKEATDHIRNRKLRRQIDIPTVESRINYENYAIYRRKLHKATA